MTEHISAAEFNSQIYEEASAWFVEMRAGDVDAAGRQRFDAWVRKSPEHLRAYLEISEIWDDVPLVDEARTGNSGDLVAKARAGADVVLLDERSPRRRVPGPVQSIRTLSEHRLRLAVAVGVVVCAVAAFLGYQQYRGPVYSTGTGEQRIVTLADGSRVELNARTRLSVHFTDRQREVELLEGQVLFNVAKNPQRPFIVQTGNLAVRAVGTEFDVDRKQNATTVTVLEGRVAVGARREDDLKAFGSPAVPAPTPILLEAGEQVTATARVHNRFQASRVNVAAAVAWTRGELVFEGSSLADVIEEFNRHNERRQLVLGDPALGNMQISGVYASTDPDLLVRFLREQPNLRVEETSSNIVITSR